MNAIAAPAVAVVCRNVIKDYGKGESRVRALRGVDLEIGAGQLTLLEGPSGCGKTTLISILAGTLDLTTGDVTVFGVELARLTKCKKTRFRAANVGFVFQQFNLLPVLTAAENVAVPLIIAGVTRGNAVARACEVLDSVGLTSRATACPRSFRAENSSGLPLRGHLCISLDCCCAMNRHRTSTRAQDMQL